MNKAMAVLPYGDETQLDNQAILQALKNLVLAVAEPPVAPMIRPRDSEDYATQSTRPSQITHDDVRNSISLSKEKPTDTKTAFRAIRNPATIFAGSSRST